MERLVAMKSSLGSLTSHQVHRTASQGAASNAPSTETALPLDGREVYPASEGPYAQVKVGRTTQHQNTPGAHRHGKSGFFHRLAKRVRKHSSHPNIDLLNVEADSGRAQRSGASHPLRNSRSLDDVVVMQDGENGMVFVNYTAEPGGRMTQSNEELFQDSAAAWASGGSSDAKATTTNASDDDAAAAAEADSNVKPSAAAATGSTEREDEELPPAIPARLYLEDDEPQQQGQQQQDDEDGDPVVYEVVDLDAVRHRASEQAEPSNFPTFDGRRGLRPSKLMTDMLALNKCGYYWGPIDDEAAAEVLAGTPDGTFLVHDSSQLHHLYAVSTVVDGNVFEFQITSFDTQTGYTFSNPEEMPRHPTPDDIAWSSQQTTIPDLIAWAQLMTERTQVRRGVRPYLIRPLMHPYTVPTLQDMCRTFLFKVVKINKDTVKHLPLPDLMKSYLMGYSYLSS